MIHRILLNEPIDPSQTLNRKPLDINPKPLNPCYIPMVTVSYLSGSGSFSSSMQGFFKGAGLNGLLYLEAQGT